MTAPNFVATDPNLALSDLNTVARQQEEVLGPLVLIGNDGQHTLLSFDMDREPPATPIMLKLEGDAAPPGAVIVSKGRCFVSGVMTDVVAWR